MRRRIRNELEFACPGDQLNELSDRPAMPFSGVRQVSLQHRSSIVVDLLQGGIREVNERDVVEEPLRLIKSNDITRMVKHIS